MSNTIQFATQTSSVLQRHSITEQSEIINEGRVDQYPEQRQVKSPMLDSSPDNQTTDYSKQSLEENESLMKQPITKNLYDSIKIKRDLDTEQSGTTSLLANNADLKAQIQEKVFAIAALKNDLRKLKGNSIDTKFGGGGAQMSKQRFASQVDVNKNLSKPVTQHYLPKKTESAFAKPDHVIASSSSRNSSKNMPRFSSNDMVHNHYLDEARKKTQERDRNSKTSVMPSARFQSTADGSKPKPRSNNQTSRSLPVSKSTRVTITAVPKADHSKSSSSFSDSKNFVCSTCHKCVFNANHDACITKLLKEVNSRANIQSHKTRNSNKPVDQKSHTQKPGRQIFTGHRFSPNKTSAVYEKTSPRSDLRWKPTGRIFKSVGLRWIPTGKLFDSCTSKVHQSVKKAQSLDLSSGLYISYALSWKPCQGDSLNLPDHRAQVDQESQIKMIQVKEMMQDNDLKSSKSKDKGSRSRSQSMNDQSHYKQDKTKTRQSINVKSHIFNVIGSTEEFEERDLNIGGDC
ncbi:hypothetical protein Tco_1406063 [Tanacetum coccineum]